MAKLPTKKPKLTPEEQLAELAALTGDVAAINLMHANVPAPLPQLIAARPITPLSAPVALEAVAARAATLPVPPRPAPAAAVVERPPDGVGEGEPTEKSTPADTLPPEPTPTAEAVEPAAASAGAAGTEYTLDALFEPSKEKKTVMMRITPALHQYFQQIGLLLGDGASVPDVVHNILLEWKSLHEKEAQKALQKQMRLMLKNAS